MRKNAFQASQIEHPFMAGLEQRDTVALGRAALTPRRHVVANPAADRRFCDAVVQLAKKAAWPEDMEDALVVEYPKVHVAESVLASGEVRWYACRDGRWVSPFKE